MKKMKNSLAIFITIFAILFTSCGKDTIEWKIIKTLAINEESHAFVSEDGKRYCENELTSQQESHVYKLEMVKGIQYRISATQPEALINNTKLTLVNSAGDTLAESLNEGISKSLIVLRSPQTTNYYLILNLIKRTNPKFNYRLYFEEIIDDVISFSGLDWESNVNWNITNSKTAELTNGDSRIYRYLKLANPVTGNPDVSFIIQTSSSKIPDFGLILEASDDLIQFGEYSYELSSTGYAFLAFKSDENYSIMRLNGGSISFDWGPLPNIAMNFSTGINVELRYEGSQYVIYLDNIWLKSINGSLNSLYIIVEDRGDGITQIKDLQLRY